MKNDHAFVAERAAAQHCPELLRHGPEPVDYTASLTRLGERFAKTLAPALAPLLGGEAPDIAVQPPADLSETELLDAVGALAANSLYATGVPGVTMLAAIEGAGLLRLVDRAFGGTGAAPKVLPAAFPLSAELMIERLEALIAAALAAALGLGESGEVHALRRDTQLSELAPFPAGARIAALRCTIGETWQLTLAVPQTMLPKLLGSGDGALAGSAVPRAADPAAAPFAEVPLPLIATLVDMPIPLSAISSLEVGTVLPVAVARSVPLAIGGAVVARGSVGTQDDRIALKLTQIA